MASAPGIKDDNAKTFIRPPEKFSKQRIEAWIQEEVQAANPDLPARAVEAEEWSDYVNHRHFVPLTVEGVPEGFEFDYNWIKEENPHHFLPSAEVTETGEFTMWWDRCNYYDLSEERCRNVIRTVVRHEAQHFKQWQQIAVNALSFLGKSVDPKRLPSSIVELQKEGARKAFMSVWSDPAHYQCREVDVYTTQMENGELSEEKMGREDFTRRLKNLQVYSLGDENSPGCAHSKWALEFSEPLRKADAILKKNAPLLSPSPQPKVAQASSDTPAEKKKAGNFTLVAFSTKCGFNDIKLVMPIEGYKAVLKASHGGRDEYFGIADGAVEQYSQCKTGTKTEDAFNSGICSVWEAKFAPAAAKSRYLAAQEQVEPLLKDVVKKASEKLKGGMIAKKSAAKQSRAYEFADGSTLNIGMDSHQLSYRHFQYDGGDCGAEKCSIDITGLSHFLFRPFSGGLPARTELDSLYAYVQTNGL